MERVDSSSYCAADSSGVDRLRNESVGHPKESVLSNAVNFVSSQFVEDDSLRSEVNEYMCGGIKTAALFLRGRVGLVGTAATHALDQMGANDGTGTQALDGALGAVKGAAMRGVFAGTEKLCSDIAVKGVVLGTGARLTDNLFDRKNYLDSRGQYDVTAGIETGLAKSINSQTLASDIFTFGLAHGLSIGANRLTSNAIANSRFLSNAFTGGAFGFASGAHAEIARQSAAGKFDFKEVGRKALVQAAVDTVATLPSGFQGTRMRPPSLAEQPKKEELADATRNRTEVSPPGDGPVSAKIESRLTPAEPIALTQAERDTNRVRAALERIDDATLAKIMAESSEHNAGSYWELSPQQLGSALRSARWESCEVRDRMGEPIINAPNVAFRAEISGGRVGLAALRFQYLPESTQVFLSDPHASGNGGEGRWEASVVGVEGSRTEPTRSNYATIVLGPQKSVQEPETILAIHPGRANRPSTTNNATLEAMGISLADLPESGPGRRLLVTPEQASKLGLVFARVVAPSEVHSDAPIRKVSSLSTEQPDWGESFYDGEIFEKTTAWTKMIEAKSNGEVAEVEISAPAKRYFTLHKNGETIGGQRGEYLVRDSNGQFSVRSQDQVRALMVESNGDAFLNNSGWLRMAQSQANGQTEYVMVSQRVPSQIYFVRNGQMLCARSGQYVVLDSHGNYSVCEPQMLQAKMDQSSRHFACWFEKTGS